MREPTLNKLQPLGVGRYGNSVGLVGRELHGTKPVIKLATGSDGEKFTGANQLHISDPAIGPLDFAAVTFARAATIGQHHILSLGFTDHSVVAVRNKLDSQEIWNVGTDFPAAELIIVPDYRHNGNFVAYSCDGDIHAALSKDLLTWQTQPDRLKTRPDQFDRKSLHLVSATSIEQGILVLYTSERRVKAGLEVQLGAALFASDNPVHVSWRAETALWSGLAKDHDVIGAVVFDDEIRIYHRDASGKLATVAIGNPFAIPSGVHPRLALKRFAQNPILEPRENEWESVGVFNPAIFQHDGKVHMLYRALNYEGMSFLGYAESSDGYSVDYRSDTPAYWPRAPFEGVNTAPYGWSDNFGSGGGWGGCEDPKLTMIDDVVYLTYVAHDGYGPPRVALSSIAIEDFLARDWSKWAWPKLISEPGIVNKSGVVLPEKINGQFVVFHRVFPNILVHFGDTLEGLSEADPLQTHGEIPIRPDMWDSRKLSVGATPIRIKEGWLVIYHAVDDRDDQKYKIGAMILDGDDPTKVLYRTNQPILEPEEYYENEWKFGIAYPSGAAIKDGTLLVYYGGGDKFVCVATANLEQFVDDLKKEKPIQLTSQEIKVKA